MLAILFAQVGLPVTLPVPACGPHAYIRAGTYNRAQGVEIGLTWPVNSCPKSAKITTIVLTPDTVKSLKLCFTEVDNQTKVKGCVVELK